MVSVADLIGKIQLYGFEYVFRRYIGIYRGIVIDNADPEKRGRVRIQVPAVGHRNESSVPIGLWSSPCMTGLSVGNGGAHGLFFPPDIGDQVFVMFEFGDPDRPIYMGGWMTRDPAGGDLLSSDASIKGIRTNSGHIIRFDDGKSPSLLIEKGDGSGGLSGTSVELTVDDTVVVKTKAGDTLKIVDGFIEMKRSNGEFVKMEDGKVTIESGKSSAVFSGKDIVISASGNVDIKAGGKLTLDGRRINVGKNATQPAVLGTSLSLKLVKHTHTGNMGAPTTPPVPPLGLIKKKELSTGVFIGG